MDVEPLRILLVGKGGREHALAWKLAQSKAVQYIYVAPGNGGTAGGDTVLQGKTSNIDVSSSDYHGLVEAAVSLGVGLVVVGPDDAVVDGISDYFKDTGIPCFAPSRDAAELEGSKTYAKDFMRRHNIPTAAYENFTDVVKAKEYVSKVAQHRLVIKADGLAAGKGVILPSTTAEAVAALEDMMTHAVFAKAGSSVVVEEYLQGQEVSILTFSDGKT